MYSPLQKRFWTEFLHKARTASNEDLLVYWLLCPSFFLYVAFHRLPLLYAAPYIYVLVRSWREIKLGNHLPFVKSNPFFLLVMVLIFLGLLSFLFKDSYFLAKPMVRDLLIIPGYLLPFVFHHSFLDKHVKAMFYTLIVAYIFWIDYREFDRFFITFFSARSTTEFDMGLFFGLFLLYFFWQKDWKHILINIFILLLVSKRAIYLGLLPAGVWLLYHYFLPRFATEKIRFGLLLFVFLSLTVFSFVVVDLLDWYFHTVKGTDKRIDFLMNGRAFSLNFILFKIQNSDLWHGLFGHGPGQLDVQISLFRPVHWAKYYPEPSNPHNDYLKLMYDYGALGFLAFGYLMSRIYSRNPLGTALFLFTLILFFFDNSLIHSYYNLISFVIFYVGVTHPNEKALHQS